MRERDNNAGGTAAPTRRRGAPPARAATINAYLDHGHKVLRHLRLGQLLADLAQRLGRPVAHDRLLDRRERLQRRQQRRRVRRAADERHEVAELLGHGQQDLVLVVAVLGEEGDELVARALLAEGEGDGGEALDRVEAADGVLVLQLVAVLGWFFGSLVLVRQLGRGKAIARGRVRAHHSTRARLHRGTCP